MGGPVRSSPLSGLFIGASRPTSASAEASAIVFALLWLLSNIGKPEFASLKGVTVLYDSTFAAGITFFFSQSLVHPALAELGTTLTKMLSSKVQIKAAHVKGHSGNPWNELADRVSEAVSVTEVHESTNILQYIRTRL